MGTVADIDATFKRLCNNSGVLGVIVFNNDGVAIRTTFENSKTGTYAGELTPLLDKAKAAIRNLDADDELQFMRLRTKKHEIMVAPDASYFMVAIQATAD